MAFSSVSVTGVLRDQTGAIRTSGRLYLTPVKFIVNNDVYVAPKTVSVDVPVSGSISFTVSPSNGVPYFIEYDPDPSITAIGPRLKHGYFRDYWTIPSSGPVDIAAL